MSADLLERAAARLRGEASNPSQVQNGLPWCPEYARHAIRHVERNVDIDLAPCPDHSEHGTFGRFAGHYIAMMHPPVALALADLLDEAAGVHASHGLSDDDRWKYEHALARAILRESE